MPGTFTIEVKMRNATGVVTACIALAVAATLFAAADAAHAGDSMGGDIKAERPPSTNKAKSSPVVRDHRGSSSQAGGSQMSSWGHGTVRDHRKPVVELHFP